MKRSCLVLALMLCASPVLAEPPPPPPSTTQSAVTELVDKQLLAPLKKAESRRRRFSRAAPTPVQRRVRVLDTVALTDARGQEFVRFAIDERRSWDDKGSWHADRMLGCAYVSQREVYLQRDERYLPASSALGKDAAERPDVCRAAPGGGVVQMAKAAG